MVCVTQGEFISCVEGALRNDFKASATFYVAFWPGGNNISLSKDSQKIITVTCLLCSCGMRIILSWKQCGRVNSAKLGVEFIRSTSVFDYYHRVSEVCELYRSTQRLEAVLGLWNETAAVWLSQQPIESHTMQVHVWCLFDDVQFMMLCVHSKKFSAKSKPACMYTCIKRPFSVDDTIPVE